MRPRTRVVALTLAAVACLAGPVSGAAAAGAQHFEYKEFSEGANIVFSPNCQYGNWVPTVDTICDDYTVWWVRFDRNVNGGPVDRSSAPFHVEFDHEHGVVHPDGSGDLLSFEFGVADATGSFDKTHLQSAHFDGITVALNDVDLATGAATASGQSVALGPFTWTAASGTYEWGSDGPAFTLSGPRHFATRCGTQNRLAHQKLTVGSVSGSVDGQSISSDPQLVQVPGLQPADATGVIFNNWFHINDIAHCFD